MSATETSASGEIEAQVRALAESVLAEHPDLDVLVSNAGIGTSGPGGRSREVSLDGYELRFAVNYLAGDRKSVV